MAGLRARSGYADEMNARHIVHIREALWKRPERGACVMVGAGLSRQADSGQSAGQRPPSWGDLAGRLQEKLGPGKPGGGKTHPAEAITARDCPRLAQQYKATFGQSALDAFLLDHVPDGEPGEVHERLLRLPWADVFTTNWDTLLEKASRRVFDRTYGAVLQPADLATTVAPRIVKLHGSFPSSRPFVVTEEDYRTYPTRCAPLVNTVQQALMESVFLLVGFSGDDPNFLHWCGWVRDQLGPAAPKLYLAGLLDLPRPHRLMLEERDVIPVDLASEVSGAPSRAAGHQSAIEWILGSLEAGETREQGWPSPALRRAEGKAGGVAPPVPPTGQPRAEPGSPSQGPEAEPLADQIKDVATTWSHNRSVYPGWPVLPISKHQHLSTHTEPWVKPMLNASPELNPTDRLSVVRELFERIELLMDPLTPELEKGAIGALSAIEEHLEEHTDLPDEQWRQVQEDRAALMLALLTDSRHDLNQKRFDEWGRKLEPIVPPGTAGFHRLRHERCLWALTAQDFSSLRELLAAWQTGNADPVWSLRKAAILVQSGDVPGGRDLAIGTLQQVEQTWARDSRVLTASRLGWALHWRYVFNLAQWLDETWKGDKSWQPAADLWVRLAPHDADARADLYAYVRQMTAEESEDSSWSFDLRRVNRVTWSDAEYRIFRCAWRVIRLIELSGLPSEIPGVEILGKHVGTAARLIGPYATAYAARLLLVGGSGNEKALNTVISQTHLARMSDEEAATLFEAAQRARDYFSERWVPAGDEQDFVRQRIENAIEIMSRCVARHGAAPAPEAFRWAVAYSLPRRWLDSPFWPSIPRLWQRAWKAMDLEARTSAVPEILQAPIPETIFARYGDPGNLLFSEHPRIRRADVDESIWASCVHRICTALRGSEHARSLALDRLNAVTRQPLLSETEEAEVAASLWGAGYQESSGLPPIGNLDDWVCLLFPEPERGLAEQRFRAKWIGRDVKEATEDIGTKTIRNVSAAWNPEHLGQSVICLSDEEEGWYWRFVEEWLRNASRRRLMFGTSRDSAVRLLVDVLMHRLAPTSVLQRLAENASPIQGRRLPTAEQLGSPENEYLMIAASAALDGSDDGDAEHRVRLGARSADGKVSWAGWHALRWWIEQSGRESEVSLRPPSVDSVRDIGVAIGTSQQSGLVGALGAAFAVYRNRNPEFIEAIHARVIRGLGQLRSELGYGVREADRQVAEEVPLRRHLCVSLAWAMTDTGRGEDEVVRSWIEAGDNDPLCLVRSVRGWHAASKADGDADEKA